MKKFILFLFLILPFYVNATVENYYMEATVLNNGDVKVREIFGLDGTYNGFDRELYYGNNEYAGSNVEIVSIKGISASSINYSVLDKNGDTFKEVGSASSGDYGYYSISNISGGISVRIYNPSSRGKLFYLEYIVKNMAIKHNDVGEVGYNIFTSLREPVDNLNIKFIIPGNKNVIRVWNHGPLSGENSIESKEVVYAKLDYLQAYEKLDMRVVFDRSVLSDSLKIDNNSVLDSIVKEETEKAEEANREREEERKRLEELKAEIERAIVNFENDRTQANKDYAISLVDKLYGYPEYDEYMNRINSILSYEEENKLKRDKIVGKTINVLCIIYLGYGIYILYEFYKKYDREYKPEFDGPYYRDFPKEYGPEIVEYLIKKRVTTDSFSASLLNLIYKKNIGYEVIDKKNYTLKILSKDNLTDGELKLINCIFGNKEVITLKELKKNARRDYDSFRTKYDSWQKKVTSEGESRGFFENNKRTGFVLYSLVPFILFFVSYYLQYANNLLIFMTILFAIISFIYYLNASKRSNEGNEDYYRWMGLKNYMKDFGRMYEKELPEIVLWEKYLVYATVFGIADKLAKTMEIKVKELQDVDTTDLVRFNMINNMVNVSNVVGSTIGEVKRVADRAYAAAHSSDSSGGGFGGGFSSGGGGSFGGGGGGGRF